MIIQLTLSLLVLCLSTLAAFYEGSNLLEDSFEWGWSTPFTLLTTDRISSANQIFILDYLIYAAKFYPLFPSIMLLSIIYFLFLTGYTSIIKKERRTFYFSILAFVMTVGCLMIVSDHVETKFIYIAILLAGIVTSALLAVNYYPHAKNSSP